MDKKIFIFDSDDFGLVDFMCTVIYNPDDTVDESTEVGPFIRSRFRVQRDLKFRKSKMEKSLRF